MVIAVLPPLLGWAGALWAVGGAQRRGEGVGGDAAACG